MTQGWNMRLQQDLRRGVTIMEAPHGRIGERLTAYRWHIDDPMPYNSSIVGNIERCVHRPLAKIEAISVGF